LDFVGAGTHPHLNLDGPLTDKSCGKIHLLLEKSMNLDTAHLKLKIRASVAVNERRQAEIRDELVRLEKEVGRLKESLGTVDAIERIAEEFQMPAEEPLWTPGSAEKAPSHETTFRLPTVEDLGPSSVQPPDSKPEAAQRQESEQHDFESDLNFNRWG
jgi:hypothetical protein